MFVPFNVDLCLLAEFLALTLNVMHVFKFYLHPSLTYTNYHVCIDYTSKIVLIRYSITFTPNLKLHSEHTK